VAMKFERERKANDAGASDADVGVMHKTSLERFGTGVRCDAERVWSGKPKFERLTSSLFREMGTGESKCDA
jgi:hypothetical protein